MRKLLSLITLTCAPLLAAAAPVIVDFEADTTGSKVNGFSAVGRSEVKFSDTSGSDLSVDDYGTQGQGKSLAIFSDDQSALKMDFGSAMNSLSLAFGNDDACCSQAGDLAYLQLFMNSVLVGETSTVMNRDDNMNQTVNFSGANFNSAIFAFTNVAKQRTTLIEVVDNISFDLAPAPIDNHVPEPSSLALAALALFGLSTARRRKQQQG